MNKKYILILILPILILIQLIFPALKEQFIKNRTYASYYCKYANQIQSATIKQAEKKYNLSCWASGSGVPYFISELMLDFNSKETGSIEKARDLMVNLTEEHLTQINGHLKAKPYLISYPFPPENSSITLSYEDGEPTSDSAPAINLVIKANQNIVYKTYNRTTGKFITIYKEPYEEAYKIVMGHPRPENLKPGPKKRPPELNRDGSIAVPAVLNNDPNNPWPIKPS